MTRPELIAKIHRTKQEIKTAGPIHKRDLQKCLRRMQAQLAEFDRFQAAARREVG